tara:strand:- start:4411 stop:4560 length:150 start_codon:yes stop_codon:yes gene_type:complete
MIKKTKSSVPVPEERRKYGTGQSKFKSSDQNIVVEAQNVKRLTAHCLPQ